MPRLIWSPAALRDVQRAYRLVSGRTAAKGVARAIRAGLKPIGRHPGIGYPVTAMPAEYRLWPIDFGRNGYLALYRHDGKEIVILALRRQDETGY